MKASRLLIAIIAALALSACGGGDTDTPDTVVSATADRACRDAAGKDVVCP